jgi:SAM-dependent methyltransferase
MKLCIGIITFNRLESLKKLVGQVKSLTMTEYDLVIAEGGADDDTVQWCLDNGLRVVTGPNLGVGRSKNMVLYYFLHHTDCDQVILLEDDCRVWETGWEQEWMLACKAWDHINWPVCPTQQYEFGANTPGSPIRTNWFGGHCTITSRAGLEKVGYLDPRFIGYGGEHAEWTWRFYRAYQQQWGEPCERNKTVPCLSNHVGVEFADTLFNKEIYKKNMALLYELMESDLTVYREPWQNETEKTEFVACIEKALSIRVEPFGIAGDRCPLCGGRGSIIGERDGVKIRQCCGILLAWAWPSEDAYMSLYLDDRLYHECQQESEGQKSCWDRDADFVGAAFMRLEWLRLLRPHARTILDVGAGTGAFVHAASRSGYSVVGLEPNVAMCDRATKEGRKLLCGTWDAAHWKYDLITMTDVFEHLTRPKACLLKLKEHLAANGLLYVEMPEAGCPQSVRDGINWKHIRPKQHLALYSDSAARQMFYVAGFQVEFSLRPLNGSLGKIAYGLSST